MLIAGSRYERASGFALSLVRVLLAPFVEEREAGREVDDIDVAPAEVAQVVAVRLLLDVADAILRDDGPETIAEAVDRGRPYAARGVAAGDGDDDGIDPLLDEVGADPGLEEDRGRLLADGEIVARVMDPRIERGARMALAEGVPDRRDLPVRHLALVHVGRVAARHGHVVAPRHLEELRGVFDRPHDQRGAAERVSRVGEGGLKIHYDDAGLFAEADRDLAVAAVLIIVHVGSLPCLAS